MRGSIQRNCRGGSTGCDGPRQRGAQQRTPRQGGEVGGKRVSARPSEVRLFVGIQHSTLHQQMHLWSTFSDGVLEGALVKRGHVKEREKMWASWWKDI